MNSNNILSNLFCKRFILVRSFMFQQTFHQPSTVYSWISTLSQKEGFGYYIKCVSNVQESIGYASSFPSLSSVINSRVCIFCQLIKHTLLTTTKNLKQIYHHFAQVYNLYHKSQGIDEPRFVGFTARLYDVIRTSNPCIG